MTLRLNMDFFKVDSLHTVPIHLAIADPPYGGIVDESWDKLTEAETVSLYLRLMEKLQQMCVVGASAYVFGGIGRPGMRPLFKAIPLIEEKTHWKMSTLITWKKVRAYGIQYGYLFCREEIAFFVLGDPKKPRVFNIPLLDEKRGYAGYDPDYPAKSEFKRRSNVWADVTEILRGKIHPCQKPDKLYEIMVQASSNPGDTVLDVFAGSGTLGRVCPDRNRILIEKAPT
jgi:DNA modification methylase